MSSEKLTILVTCTDRKSAKPHASLLARNLPPGDITERARAWRKALKSDAPATQLARLYMGEHWTQVKLLVEAASSAGYEPDVLVVSAGLGLRSIRESAPAYAATFATGHTDSVARTPGETQDWWQRLPHTVEQVHTKAIWVLSETYSRTCAPSLLDASPARELLVFGGSSDIPSDVRVPADRALRRELGGALTSLNVRMAVKWLTLSADGDAFGQRARTSWASWSERSRRAEVYERESLSDSEVVDLIRYFRAQRPAMSQTSALRTLRDAGKACEQRRFAALFELAVAHA